MIRILAIATSVLLCTATAMAGMTPEQMKKRVAEIEVQIEKMYEEAEVNSGETIINDLRDLDRRTFENDVDLARVNARREVILIRAKEEEARRQTENEVLKRKLDNLAGQRGVIQNELSAISDKVDAGKLPPQEVTTRKLQLIKLDEEAATVEYQMSGGGSRFSEALAEIEVDLAGINAERKALEQRAEVLNARRQAHKDFEANHLKLLQERDLLRSEFERITGMKMDQAGEPGGSPAPN